MVIFYNMKQFDYQDLPVVKDGNSQITLHIPNKHHTKLTFHYVFK